MALKPKTFVQALDFVDLIDRLCVEQMEFCRAEWELSITSQLPTEKGFRDYLLKNYGIIAEGKSYRVIDEHKFLLFRLKFSN